MIKLGRLLFETATTPMRGSDLHGQTYKACLLRLFLWFLKMFFFLSKAHKRFTNHNNCNKTDSRINVIEHYLVQYSGIRIIGLN